MSTGPEGLVVERPALDDADAWFALDALQTLWPLVISYTRDEATKIYLSWKLWSEMSKLKFKDGMSPVDRVNRTLFGIPVEPQDWQFERIEHVLPVEVKVRGRA